MTTNTSYREQGRAVFLAAIMVLSMVAGAAVLAGSAAASHEADGTSVAVGDLNGQSYWQGETLNISGFSGDETVEFEQDEGDGFEQEVATNGHVEVDTSSMSTGDWTATGVDSTSNGSFTIRVQEIQTFEFDPSTADASTTLSIDSNRANYNFTLSSDSIDAEEFDAAFSSGEVHDENFVLSDASGTDFDVNPAELPQGEHEITAEVVDTTASESTTLTVEEPPETAATFGFDNKDAVVGDVAELEFETSGEPDEFWFTIVDDNEYYDATVHVDNIDHDEDLVVDWNLHDAPNNNSNLGLSSDVADVTVTDASGTAIDEVDHLTNLDGGWTFELETYASNSNLNDGDFDDIAGVNVDWRSTGEVSTMIAPGSGQNSIDDDLDDLVEASSDSDTVAETDLLIAEVGVDGVFGYVNTTPSAFGDEGGLDFEFTGPEPDFGTAPGANVSQIGNDNVTIVDRPDEDALYVVVAASTLEDHGITDGDTWDATFSIDADNNDYLDESEDDADEEASTSFTWEERSVDFTLDENDDGRLILPADSEAEVTAETNVAPGTEANLRVDLPRDFRTASDEVGDNGQISLSIDLSGEDEGTQLNDVRLRVPNSDNEAEQGGIIGTSGPGDDGTASFSASGDAPSSVTVGDDAQVDVTVTNDGDASGTAEIDIEVGEDSWSVEEELGSGDSWSESYDVPTDSEGSVSWSVDTQHDADSGTVEVSAEDDSDDMSDDEDDSSEEDSSEDDSSGDDDSQPGFGAAIALLALIGAALLAVRRQN